MDSVIDHVNASERRVSLACAKDYSRGDRVCSLDGNRDSRRLSAWNIVFRRFGERFENCLRYIDIVRNRWISNIAILKYGD